jgi:hypothetical protein
LKTFGARAALDRRIRFFREVLAELAKCGAKVDQESKHTCNPANEEKPPEAL